MKSFAVKMNSKGSLTRAIRDLRQFITDPYTGIMYDNRNKPVDGKWINGLRLSDAKILLELAEKELTSS